MALSQTQIDAVLAKLDSGNPLSASEAADAAQVVRALGATLVAIDEANQDLQFNLSLFKSAADADAAARNGILAGLQVLAPPAVTVDIDGAMKAIVQLRQDIKKGKDIATVVSAATKFAIKVAGRFV